MNRNVLKKKEHDIIQFLFRMPLKYCRKHCKLLFRDLFKTIRLFQKRQTSCCKLIMSSANAFMKIITVLIAVIFSLESISPEMSMILLGFMAKSYREH